jgi:hypothetical protein
MKRIFPIIAIFCLSLGLYFTWTVRAGDFGFEKPKITILDIHSHPRVGDNWEIAFEATGKADLTITPIDQASIDDLDFVSLKCADEERNLQILENNVIFYPNWQCQETGQITHLVNTAGEHTLKFQFGDQTGYAYNSPDTETLRPNAAGDEESIYTATSGPGNHWQDVDEETPDDATTRVVSPSLTYQRDLYNLPAHSEGSGTINFIKVYFRSKEDWVGVSCYAKPSLKSDSTITDGDEVELTGDWVTYSQQWSTNPADNEAWEWSDIDALQIGVSLKSTNTEYAAYCTQVYVEVDYTVLQGSEQTFTVNNVAPVVSAVKLNNDADMTLTNAYGDSPNYTNINVTGTVTDNNGCGDIVEGDTLADAFTDDMAHTACDENGEDDENDCYALTSCTLSGCGGGSDLDVVATCAVGFYYHADPTVANTPKADYKWTAFLKSKDEALDATPVEAGTKVEMNDFVSLDVTSTIPYGLPDTEILRPNAAGTYTENTPEGETNNWACVDEEEPDDNTTKIYHQSASFKVDTYNIPNSGVGAGTINSVKVYFRTRAETSENLKAKAAVYTNSALHYGDEESLPNDNTYHNYSYTWTNNPETESPWTWNEIDALEIGMAGHSDAAGDSWTTQVYVEVVYTSSSLAVGEISDSTNLPQTTTITEAGNTGLDVTLYGVDMTGAGTIAVGKQKYAATAVTYGTATALLVTPGAEHELDCQKTTVTGTPETEDVYWGLQIPDETPTGAYTGTNTFTGKMTEIGEW